MLFPPLTCLDVQGSHVKDEVMCIDIRSQPASFEPSGQIHAVQDTGHDVNRLAPPLAGLSINQMNDTIEKVIAKMQRSHLELINLLLDDLQFAGGELSTPT